MRANSLKDRCLEPMSTAMNQQGFPRAWFSDSVSMLEEEARNSGDTIHIWTARPDVDTQ